MWNSRGVGRCLLWLTDTHQHPHYHTPPYHKCLPLDKALTKALFYKRKPLPYLHLLHSAGFPVLFLYCLTVFMCSPSLWDCFSSTCSRQISVSCHLSVVNRHLSRLGPGLQVEAGAVEGLTGYERLTGENTGVCNLISVSLLCLSFSLSGIWESVTVGRCWPTEEPRNPCWWWKVTYHVLRTCWKNQIYL